MNPVQVARKVLPPIILDGFRWVQIRRAYGRYRGRKVPWSPGYDLYKKQFIMGLLANDRVLKTFQRGESLPVGYGVAVDERCIEYPWLLAHLGKGPEMLLDAGSALNHDYILDQPNLRNKVIHVLTLAPEANCFWHKGISYLYHDLRDSPIRSDYYDVIVCVSTLEHVGFDNTVYSTKGDYREHRREDFVHAVQELRRLLKKGGSLFVTVPFGTYRDFSSFQQFDRELLFRAVDAFGEARDVKEAFYRYSSNGWNISTAEDCADCEYVEWITRIRGHWPRALPVEPDLAAAARAVACLKLVKA